MNPKIRIVPRRERTKNGAWWLLLPHEQKFIKHYRLLDDAQRVALDFLCWSLACASTRARKGAA